MRGSSSISPIGVYPTAGVRSISRTISRAASPAPTTITSLPRAITFRACGRSMIERATSREPVMNASVSRKSSTAIERGSRTLWTGETK